jgi:hypothetical protein
MVHRSVDSENRIEDIDLGGVGEALTALVQMLTT